MNEVIERNFTALSDGLKRITRKSDSNEVIIKKLEHNILELQIQIDDLQMKVTMLSASLLGNGPTA